jgi:hypothetical protein
MFQRTPQDELLFSLDKLEGEYTAWTHIYTADFGAGAALAGLLVLNDGTVGTFDPTIPAVYRVDLNATITAYVNRVILFSAPYYSVQRKYVACWNLAGAGVTLEIYRNGRFLWTRNLVLDTPLAVALVWGDFSPNGRYGAALLQNLAGDNRYIALYRGTP